MCDMTRLLVDWEQGREKTWRMVCNIVKVLLVALFCATLLLYLLDAKDFRYKRYTFRKKQRLVSIF